MNPESNLHKLSDGTPYFCCECVARLEKDRDAWKAKYEALSDKHGETVLKFNECSHIHTRLKSRAERLEGALRKIAVWQTRIGHPTP